MLDPNTAILDRLNILNESTHLAPNIFRTIRFCAYQIMDAVDHGVPLSPAVVLRLKNELIPAYQRLQYRYRDHSYKIVQAVVDPEKVRLYALGKLAGLEGNKFDNINYLSLLNIADAAEEWVSEKQLTEPESVVTVAEGGRFGSF